MITGRPCSICSRVEFNQIGEFLFNVIDGSPYGASVETRRKRNGGVRNQRLEPFPAPLLSVGIEASTGTAFCAIW